MENRRLNAILLQYRQQFDLEDFSVASYVDCSRAISILAQAASPLASSDLLSQDSVARLRQLTSHVPDSEAFTSALLEAKTPFDVITSVRMTIDELVRCADGAAGSRSTSTDDILPLLAYTIVKSGLEDLESLLFYIKNFTQSSLGPEYEWVHPQMASRYLTDRPGGASSPFRLP
jgi:hypothetical protein